MSALNTTLDETPGAAVVSQSVGFCSGHGQHHTANPDAKHPKPYTNLSMANIMQMMADPKPVPKEKGQWVIFSDDTGEHGRNAEHLRSSGALFYALWGDIDEAQGVTAQDVLNRTAFGATKAETHVYTSRSATEENQKCRIIVPLAEPVDAITYEIMQEVLNNKLESEGLIPDRVTQTCNQLCYLPNRGTFYWSDSLDFMDDYDALHPARWAKEVAAIVAERKAEEDARQARMVVSAARYAELVATQGVTPIQACKEAYGNLRDLWLHYGGKAVGNRVISPNSSTGSAGVTFKDDKWFSSHGSDVSLGLGQVSKDGRSCWGDSFDLVCFYEFGNDRTKAVKEMAEKFQPEANHARRVEHAKAKDAAAVYAMFTPEIDATAAHFDSVFSNKQSTAQPEPSEAPAQDNERNPSKFASIISKTKIGQYATQLADERQMPRDTTVLTALGVVSAAVSMIYSVGYRYASQIPTSLYIATEQPASTGKSGVLDAFTVPIQRAIRDMNRDAAKHNAELAEDDDTPRLPQYRAFVTDATPESLDGLLPRQHGHFCLASAEQGLVNTALGLNYGGGERKSNNDLILKGATGDWHSSLRVTRAGFEGNVFGSVAVIAQRGTIDTILEQSNATGLAERFIMLAEPTLLGYRDHLSKRARADYDLKIDYENATQALIKQYDNARRIGSVEYDWLERLELSGRDWDKIDKIKQQLEPTMADGGKNSHELLRGVVGKFDQRVMKLAAVLHVVESVMAGEKASNIIGSHYVDMAIDLANLSIEQLHTAMIDKGLIGMSAEEEVIYRIISNKGGHGILWNELYNATKGVQPFKSYPSKGMAASIRAVCQAMVTRGLLSAGEVLHGGKSALKLFAQ